MGIAHTTIMPLRMKPRAWQAMHTNVLRLCDGRIENLIINRDVSAAIAKTLLAAGLSHNTNKNGKLEEI